MLSHILCTLCACLGFLPKAKGCLGIMTFVMCLMFLFHAYSIVIVSEAVGFDSVSIGWPEIIG